MGQTAAATGTRVVELSAGAIEYEDSGGDGPPLVLLHGLVMGSSIWDEVVEAIGPDIRCLRPTMPLGAHRRPMRPDADLSLRGMGKIVAEFLERLDLREATLCVNDWSAVQPMVADGLCERVGRLAFVSCEAYDNYPPGIPGHLAWLSAKLPGGISIMRRMLLTPWVRGLPIVFGNMSKRGVPDEMIRAWMEPLGQAGVRRDVRRYAGNAMVGRKDMLAATPALASFEGPVLIAWGAEDKLMPIDHAHRLAADFPNARLVVIPGSYTLVPWDQPEALAAELRELVSA